MKMICMCIITVTHSTPLPTPTHKYNEWVSGKKSMGLTPQAQGKERGGEKEPMQFKSEVDRDEWEEEQKVCVSVRLS